MKFLFVLLLLSVATAFACPGDAGEPLPPPDKLEALERELVRLAPECGDHPGYLAYRGAALNALGRPGEAALLLERALMLDPRRAGAQIDYAAALAALGDRDSAQALLSDVLARPDVPAALRPRLERQLDAINVLGRYDALTALSGLSDWGSGWQGAGSVTFKLGRDSNLNSAPASGALTLTLPDGNVVLALADRFRPRAGTAALVEASGQAVKPLADGAALQVYGEARAREGRAASDTNFRQVQAGGAWSQPLDSGFAIFGASASNLRYGGDDLFRAVRFSAGRDWLAGRCRPSLGLETEQRIYPVARELEGRFVGLSGGASCSLGDDRLVLRVRGGQDTERGDRPGGNQRQSDVRLVWVRPLGAGRLGADLLWFHQQDTRGFSPLLKNGANRRLDRVNLNLEYAYPIAAGWSVLTSFESLTQRSNLSLFDINGRAFYLGVRWAK